MPDLTVDIPEGEVTYPLLVSVYADTKIGKTYFAASFPNVVLIDFPPAKLSFGKLEFDQIALSRSVGEGFRSVFRPVRKPDGHIAWQPKIDGFDYQISTASRKHGKISRYPWRKQSSLRRKKPQTTKRYG